MRPQVNSKLPCYLAIVLNSQGHIEKMEEALDILTIAIEADPKNSQVRAGDMAPPGPGSALLVHI